MLFNPQLDLVVWVLSGLVLVLLGARAWVVETGHARLSRGSAKVRVLTAASVLAIGGLFVMMWFQGGWLMYDALFKGADPKAVYYSADDPVPQPADPAAPPADPAAPPAAPAPADGATPPAGGAPAPPAGG
jgi:hypothetical protein